MMMASENQPADRQGILFVISAPSGAGKSTLVQSARREIDFSFIVSCTTRQPRPGEQDGVEYHFVDTADFENKIRQGDFLEYARVFGGHYYGTPRREVIEKLEAGQDVFLDIDVEGAAQIRALKDQIIQDALVDIFLMPPSAEELENRLRSRATESDEEIQIRLQTASREMAHWRQYRYTLVSSTREVDLEKFTSIIIAERMKTERYR